VDADISQRVFPALADFLNGLALAPKQLGCRRPGGRHEAFGTT